MTPPPPECRNHRIVLSAVADGAATPTERAAAEAHLAACSGCREYRSKLEELRLVVARSTVPSAPDLVPALWAVMAEARPRASRPGERASLARYLLGAAAFTQMTLGAPALLLGRGAGDVHDSRHLGAWALAFGVGLLLAAVRPRHARTLLPIATTLTVAVAVSTVIDLIGGQRAAGPEAIHVLEVVGLALLAVVHRQSGAGPHRPRPFRRLPVPAPGT
jgi:predicted anti-sigma-YlaC factor YlaD